MTSHVDQVRRKRHLSRITVIKYRHVWH